MKKEVGAFSLIIFLFVIVVTWWAVSSFRVPVLQTGVVATNTPTANTEEYVPSGPVQIYHSTSKGSEVYHGSFNIPSCDNFLTGISTSGNQPTHLRLSFTISKQSQDCTSASPKVAVPFSVTYSSSKSKQKPVVESVKINNMAAAFSVIEATN